MGPTVLVTDTPWASTHVEEDVLAELEANLVRAESGEEAELLELVEEADAILTCFAQVTPAVVAAGGRLRVIGRYGVGTDNIAVAEATTRGIPVTNVPSFCVDEVVEHVLGMLLALARGIHRYDRAVRKDDWSLDPGLPIRRVAGRTLGIVGFGSIGRRLGERARALGIHVVVHSRDRAAVTGAGYEFVALDELAKRANFVSLHVPLTAETRGMVDGRFLSTMGPDSYLINCARGAIVDHAALVRALERGSIGGAAMDVFEPEHLAPGDPLLASPRLLATPHVAYYSDESMQELARAAAQNVADVLAGRSPASIVNGVTP